MTNFYPPQSGGGGNVNNPLDSDLDAGGFTVENLVDPVDNQDAATKHYVLVHAASGGGSPFTGPIGADPTVGPVQVEAGNFYGDASVILEGGDGSYFQLEQNQGDLLLYGTNASGDPVNSVYISDLDGFRLSMPLDLQTHNIINVVDGTNPQDAATMHNLIPYLPRAGGQMVGDLDMNGNFITNLADPSGTYDAATKNYVDTHSGGASWLSTVKATSRYPSTINGIPEDWVENDVGTMSLQGTCSFSAGTFTFDAVGLNDGTGDSLSFLYETITGDGEITCRVASSINYGGLMVRNTKATGKAFFATYTSVGLGTGIFYRSTDGGSVTIPAPSIGPPPVYVRITKIGTLLTAYNSSDGITWTSVFSTTITFLSTCLIGLWAQSGSTSSSATTLFDNVHTEGVIAASVDSGVFTSSTDTYSIDGVSIANTNVVLLRNQIDTTRNGIFIVNTGGNWQRPVSVTGSNLVSGLVVQTASGGATNSSQAFTLISPNPLTSNVSTQIWDSFPYGFIALGKCSFSGTVGSGFLPITPGVTLGMNAEVPDTPTINLYDGLGGGYCQLVSSGEDIYIISCNNIGTELQFIHLSNTDTVLSSRLTVPHLIGSTSAPGASNGDAGLGAGGTVSVSGTDLGHVLTVTQSAGDVPSASAIVTTVTFNQPFDVAPVVILTPADANSAGLAGTAMLYVDQASTTTAHYVIKSGAVPLPTLTGRVYKYNVLVIG